MFCGKCGAPLEVLPSGARVQHCRPERGPSYGYWSDALPLPRDLAAYRQLTDKQPIIVGGMTLFEPIERRLGLVDPK